jgi:hypothetical protein
MHISRFIINVERFAFEVAGIGMRSATGKNSGTGGMFPSGEMVEPSACPGLFPSLFPYELHRFDIALRLVRVDRCPNVTVLGLRSL